MKKNKRMLSILTAITCLLVITTVALLFLIGPWKKSSETKESLSNGKDPTNVTTQLTEDSSTTAPSITATEATTTTSEEPTTESTQPPTDTPTPTETPTPTPEPTATPEPTPTPEETTQTTTEATTETTAEPTTVPETTPEPTKTTPNPGKSYDLSGMVIVIDPGHQRHANSDTEPVAPWSDERKAKVSAGTKGVSTGRPEYEVVLEIGLKMRDVLQDMGATVIMTRTSNDVDISNVERAQIAVDNNADVFLRLHCDAGDSSSSRGIGVFVCSRGDLADSQVKWGNWLGNCLAEATGSKYRGCDASTRYSGLNWATSVPSFLLEMGFMTNSEDDRLLSDPDYQQKICQGVAAFCYKMKNR